MLQALIDGTCQMLIELTLLLGTGVREKRSYDADGTLVFRNRVSDYSGVGLLVSDSLSYDKADRVIRAWQEAHNQAADQTLISYDGLGAVVARGVSFFRRTGRFSASLTRFAFCASGGGEAVRSIPCRHLPRDCHSHMRPGGFRELDLH